MIKKRFAALVLATLLIAGLLPAQNAVQKVRLWDTNLSHNLTFRWNENDSANRILNFLVAGATRSLTISGDSYIDQDVRIAASPTFASATLNLASGDPVLHFSLAAVNKYTMGIDDSDGDSFKLSAGSAPGTTDILKITPAGWVGLNESANVNMTTGLTINQGAADDEILAFKSSDVWNGLDVAWVETDTFAQFLKLVAATGGLSIRGLGEGATGLQMEGFGWTGIVDTTRLSTSTGITNIVAHEVNYNGTVEMALSANVNLLAIRHGLTPTTAWVLDVDGDSWQPGTVTGTQLISTIAEGTAPLGVTSTTVVPNLNASLLEGSAAAAFEPALGNPATTGWVLSSTDAGVRSWVAAGGGAGAFTDLTDVPSEYTGAGGYDVKVNAGEDGLEFIAPPSSTAIIQEATVHLQSYRDSINGSTTYYFTANPNFLLGTDEGEAGEIRIPIAGTIKAAWILWNSTGVTGTDEDISIYYRAGGDDTLIATVGDLNRQKYFVNDALSIAVAEGAYFHMKVVTPNWATPPSYVKIHGYLYIEQVASGPSFDHVHLTVADGTAPMVVTSSTEVANLNAHLLQGHHAADFAHSDAKYITQEVSGDLSAEQSLGALATGILKNTTTGSTGVLSIATAADLPAHQLDGAGHTVSGLTAGHFLKALTPTTFGFAAHGLALNSLTDLNAGAPNNGDALIWDSATSKWIADAVGVGALALDDLSDVNAAAPNDNDALTWDSATSKWIAAPGGAGGGAPTDADYVVETANGDLSAESVLGTTVITTAAYASRQAAAKAGRVFLPNDGFVLERDTGAAWQSWGPLIQMTRPIAGDFAWVNQGTATITDSGGAIYLWGPKDAGANSLRIMKKAAPATPYIITACIMPHVYGGTSVGVGVLFRESATGKIHNFSFNYQVATNLWKLYSSKYDNATTWNSSYVSQIFTLGWLIFLRIEDDGRKCSWSVDGQNFLLFHSVGRTDYLTADEVGFYVNPANATWDQAMTLLSWKKIGLSMPAFKDLSAVDKSARLELARKKLGPGVSRDEWAEICKRLGLKKVVGSTGIYGGTCLFCQSPKDFYFWLDGISGLRCRCFNCNFEGHVRTSMTRHKKPNRGDEF